jgi:uncharacterized protein YbjT (DUF2867 family)
MDRILLTGATGVVGRRVLPLLVAAGHRVTAVSRSADQQELLRAVGAKPVSMNLLDPASVRAAVDGHDVVINLATHMPSSMLRSSGSGTPARRRSKARAVADACRRAGLSVPGSSIRSAAP